MQFYLAVAFLFVLIALCAVFRPSADDMEGLLELSTSHISLKKQAQRQRKEGRFMGMLRRTQTMLAATGQANRLYILLALSLFLCLLGFTIAASFDNYFLAPVLAFGLASIPFLYIRFQNIKYKKLVVEELETALSVISVSYERTENILLAIEENLQNIDQPIRQVFEEFVYTVKYVNPSIEHAIEQMKPKIQNSVFIEWCDALRRCAQNRSLKHTLRPIVTKLTEIKIVSNDLKNILYKSIRTYWELLATTVCVLILGLYVIPQGLSVELPASLTNLLVAINALLIVIATIRVVIETHDIKFDI
jgi:hypothetical protein